MPLPAVIAHRAGAALGPENSLAALEAAICAGAEWAEIDLQLSVDGVPLLLHDRDLSRVAGLRRKVSETPANELPPLANGEPLPTLARFLAAARGRIRLMLELKDYGRSALLPERVVGLLREQAAFDELLVCSFSLPLVQAVKRLEPRLRVGLVLDEGGAVPAGDEIGFLSVAHRAIDAALVRTVRGRGIGLFAWTVNDPLEMKRLTALGVDGLISDDPPAVQRALADWRALPAATRAWCRLRARLTGAGAARLAGS